MAKAQLEAQLNDLLEEVADLKKFKKGQQRQLKVLNETLLSELKYILNPEVFALIETQLSSQWGQFQYLETTDAILTEYIKAVQNLNNRHSTETQNWKRKLEKSEKSRKEAERQLLKISEEADFQVDQITTELNKSLSVQKELKEQNLALTSSEFTTTSQSLPLSALINCKSIATKGVQTSSIDHIFAERVEVESEMSFEKISKTVCRVIPVFSGERTPDLTNKVHEFLNACQLGLKCLDEGVSEEAYVSCISSRLTGDAFDLIRSNPPKNLRDLESVIRTAYLEIITLDSVMLQIKQAYQLVNEDFQAYARRLLRLKTKAIEIIDSRYTKAQSAALVAELDLSLVRTYKMGLFDPVLRQFMLTTTETDLAKLADQAQGTSQLMGTHGNMGIPANFNNFYSTPNCAYPPTSLNQHQHQQQSPFLQNIIPHTYTPSTHSSLLPNNELLDSPHSSNRQQNRPEKPIMRCGFCGKQNHTYAECQTRKRTPYCDLCQDYGHIHGRCPQSSIRVTKTTPKPKVKCKWCSRMGHVEEECFSKQNYLKDKSGNHLGAS